MAKTKASITRKDALSANGILDINEAGIFIENENTGELIDLKVLLSDFADKTVKLSVTYDYDYDTDPE